MDIPTPSLEKVAAMPAARAALSALTPSAPAEGSTPRAGTTPGQTGRTSAFTPLPALPTLPMANAEVSEKEAGDGTDTEDEDEGPPPQQLTTQASVSAVASLVLEDDAGPDDDKAVGRGHTKVAHTKINAPTLDGFLTVTAAPKAQKPVRDSAAAITRNAEQAQKLADRIRLLEQGSGGQQDARCLVEFGAYKKAVEDLSLQVRELQRRPLAAGLEDFDAADVTNSIEEARQYIIKLAGVTNDLSSALSKKGDEVAWLRAEIDALKVRMTFRTARAELPALPSILAGHSIQCTPRPRSASLEAAHAGPATKRAREAGPADVATTDGPVFWGILLGPYGPLETAKGRGLLTEVAKILDELRGAEHRTGPYAVLADRNGKFVLAYFTSKEERNSICDAWPPTEAKFKSVRAEKKDNLAHPPPEALFKDVKDRKTAEKLAQGSRA